MVLLDAAASFIGQFGFPIFVATVLLFQVTHMHRENHQMIDRLADEVGLMRQSLDRLVHVLLSSSELQLMIRDQAEEQRRA